MKNKILFWLVGFVLMTSCSSEDIDYYPKPRGFLKMDFPEKVFTTYRGDCPYTFEIPEYFEVIDKGQNCNKDINMPRFKASLFLTYLSLDTNLMTNVEYSRKLVYDHSIKADEIREAKVHISKNSVYGTKYKIIGDAASPYQFYVTDSINHFLRGALYFNARPNYDSLKPSLVYVLEDVEHMIETINWNPQSDSLMVQ